MTGNSVLPAAAAYNDGTGSYQMAGNGAYQMAGNGAVHPPSTGSQHSNTDRADT